MTKRQFLETLKTALNGRVASDTVMENLRYYEDYINTEIRKGKDEEEVMEALGDPRLIARTIVETDGGEGRQTSGSREEYYHPEGLRGRLPRILLKIPVWVWPALFLLIVALILSVVFSVIAAVLPVLLPVMLMLLLIKAFRERSG